MVHGPRLVILGKQGAGKGTQCTRIAEHYVIPHISTGEIFRATMKGDGELSERLRTIIDAGNLVPDDVTNQIVRERLDQDDTRTQGFVLDGYPRTIQQAAALSDMLTPDDIDLAIDLELPTEAAVQRLATRLVCRVCATSYGAAPSQRPRLEGVCDRCGGEVIQRADDNEEAIRRRLALYEKETEPIITWYLERDMLITVDAAGEPEEVTARLFRAIDRRRS